MINEKQLLTIKQKEVLPLTKAHNSKETKFKKLISYYVLGFHGVINLRSSRI